MQLIARQELTSAASSITFSSIPATFTDLVLLVSIRESRTDIGSASGPSWTMRFNGLTTNQSQRDLRYTTSVSTSADSSFFMWSTTGADTANTFTNGHIYIPNYTSSAAKSFSSEQLAENNGNSGGRMSAGLWNDTAAITSLSMHPSTGNFVSGSSATLYGILAGTDGIVSVS
jgi:hypothetical protein